MLASTSPQNTFADEADAERCIGAGLFVLLIADAAETLEGDLAMADCGADAAGTLVLRYMSGSSRVAFPAKRKHRLEAQNAGGGTGTEMLAQGIGEHSHNCKA